MPQTSEGDIVVVTGYILDVEMFDHSVDREKDKKDMSPSMAKLARKVSPVMVGANNVVIDHDVIMKVTITRLLDIPDLINSKVRTLEKVVSKEVRAPEKEVHHAVVDVVVEAHQDASSVEISAEEEAPDHQDVQETRMVRRVNRCRTPPPRAPLKKD